MKKIAADLAKANNFPEDLSSFITVDLEEDVIIPAMYRNKIESVTTYFSNKDNYEDIKNNVNLTSVGLAIGSRILKEGLCKIYHDINYAEHVKVKILSDSDSELKLVKKAYSYYDEIPVRVTDGIVDNKDNRDGIKLTFVINFEDIMRGNGSQAKLIDVNLYRCKKRSIAKCYELTAFLKQYGNIGDLYKSVLEEFIKGKDNADSTDDYRAKHNITY